MHWTRDAKNYQLWNDGGDLTTGVVYDYLRLELDEAAKFTASNE
jgi:hypothetical protein